jgi:parallel beta-helix repeat protein
MNLLKSACLVAALMAADSLWLCAQTVVEPAPSRYFISPSGNDQWTGKLVGPNPTRTDGPFATIGRALEEMRKQPLKCTTYVRGAIYHLSQPIEVKPEDSGHTLMAYPGEKPVISGALAVKGWNRATNDIWVVKIPEVQTKRLFFGQFWLDTELQTRARYPNIDPANPYTAGWNFVASEGPGAGAFGAVISRIHNAGDWVEWSVDAPVAGTYRLALLYAAQNAQSGFNNMGGRCSLQVGSEQPVIGQNLPDTQGAYRWSVVATVNLAQGPQIIRWNNLQGGYINLDALALSDDPAWNAAMSATGSALARPAGGRQLVVVQAEALTGANAKDMVRPNLAPTATRGRFHFRPGELKEYPKSPEAEIHMFPGTGLANTIMQLRGIDPDKRIVTLQPNSSSAMDILPGNRYFIANAFEELDSPGEWYLDRASGNLYFWPPRPTFQDQIAFVPVLDRLIEIKGDPARSKWVDGFSIRGFEFRHTTYARAGQILAPNDAAIWLSGARGCVLESNRFVNLGGHAVRLENKSTGNEIVGNEMTNLGQGGVIFHGAAATQATSNLVAGNWIHHVGEVYKHVAGVFVSTGSGNRIAHNLIEHLPRYAVSLRSYDAANYSHTNIVEYNDIQFTNLETVDSGAVETLGRHRKDTGNVIQYNRIRDTGGLGTDAEGKFRGPYFTWGIQLDDFSSGTVVKGNVVLRSVLGGVAVLGGKNNVIENNVFVDGAEHQVFYQVVDGSSVSNRFNRNIVAFSDGKANLIQHSGTWVNAMLGQADRNLYWHAQGANIFASAKTTPRGALKNWQASGFDRGSMIADPMFMNPAQDIYQPANASPAKQLGFESLPLEKIGLQGFERSWKKK